MCDKKIDDLLKLALNNQNLTNYDVRIQGQTGKEDDYLSNVTFVTVTENGKTHHLAVKSSKESEDLREQAPVREAFEKEIFIYDVVKPAFDDFQREKGTKELLQIMPHCYLTKVTETSELLVLENLKAQGYGLWDRTLPMTFAQIKLVLEAYGKWHALCMALKRHKRDTFEKLAESNVNVFSCFVSKCQMVDYFTDIFSESRDSAISIDEVSVLKRLQFSSEDVRYILVDMYYEDPDYQVILHGDCWNNNFLFKFEDASTDVTDVRIIDWQCSGLGSPVIDLSDFIYGCCDTDKYKDVKELLSIYYGSFSEYLKVLGCEPEEVFSFEKLMEHWRRFSKFGVLVGTFNLKFSLCEKDDSQDFAQSVKSAFVENFRSLRLNSEEKYLERIKSNLLHYVYNLD